MARGNWILFLDADEALSNARFLRFRLRYLTGKKTGAFLMERTETFRHKASGKIESIPTGLIRLFRNHAGIRFVYRVHETVNASILDTGFVIKTLFHIKIRHKIFLSESARLDAKQKKYMTMIDAHLADDPGDSWMLFQKAKIHWYFDENDEALALYKRLIRLDGTRRNIKATACCHAASICMYQGHLQEATGFLTQSLALIQDQSLAWLIRGDIHFRQGNFSDALVSYNQLRTTLPYAYEDSVFSYLYTPAPAKLFKMGCCHLALGNIRKAYFLFRSGLKVQSGASENWLGLAHCYHTRKQYAKALRAVTACLSLNPAWDQALALKEKITTGLNSH
jgi:tetratricopeptide (TPR) repeat protein